MKKMCGIIAFASLLVLTGLIVTNLQAYSVNPLTDRIDAIVVKGETLPGNILNSQIETYRVFASSGSGLVAIPMQIDELDDKKNFLFKSGPGAGKGDGKFNARDELAFMARDAGPAYSGPPPSGCKSVPLTISDKKSGASGFVILAQCDTPPQQSSADYVGYDPKERIITTSRYRFGWKEKATYYYDYMSINNGPDILDRLKVRASIGKLGVKYTFNEENFKFSFADYTDGPVRVLWRADNYWSLGPLGKIPMPTMATFYDEYAVLDNPMDTRLNPALFGLDLTVVIGHDLALDKKRDYSVCTNVNPDCNSLRDPNMENIAKSIVEKDLKWGGVKGPEGALITHFVPDKGLNVRVIGAFRYDDEYRDHPEYIKGSSPLLGFKLVNWKNVKSGISLLSQR